MVFKKSEYGNVNPGIHIDADVHDVESRDNPHAANVLPLDIPSAQAKVYKFYDSDTGTVTVDPINRDSWILDDSHRFVNSAARGIHFDTKALKESLRPESAPELSMFVPTTAMLDSADKWPIPNDRECKQWSAADGSVVLRNPARYGKLPVVSQHIYDQDLLDKSIGQIEHEIREAERRQATRLFDRTGNCR